MVSFKQAKKTADIFKNAGTPLHPGLVPAGDGWYKTPESVDPRDCNNYPDSPWCGGNPLTRKAVDLGIKVGVDTCHVAFSLTGALGFIKMPPRTIAYVRPECVDDYENRDRPTKPKPPPPKPGRQPLIDFYNRAVDPEEWVYAIVGAATINIYDVKCPGNPIPGVISGVYFPSRISFRCKGQWKGGPDGFHDAGHEGIEYHYISPYNGLQHHWIRSYSLNHFATQREIEGFTTIVHAGVAPPFVELEVGDPSSGNSNFPYGVIRGQWKHILMFCANVQSACFYEEKFGLKCHHVASLSCSPRPTGMDNPPPPPPPKNCCDDMGQCCPENKSVDNDLLRQVLAKLEKIDKSIGTFPTNVTVFDANENEQEAQTQIVSIGSVSQGVSRTIERVEKVSKIIGIDALPLTVPETISEPVNQNILETVWDWLTPDATRKINNLFELLVWQTEQYSATMGQWQQSIEIQDTNVLKEGDQKQKIALPDVATTLKEILSLQMQTYKTLGLVLDICLKDLTQDAATYKELVAVQLNIKEMIDFLDYQTDEKYVDVPVQISVPGTDVSREEQNNLVKYLQPSTVKVRYQNWTGFKSLTDLLTHLATLIGRR